MRRPEAPPPPVLSHFAADPGSLYESGLDPHARKTGGVYYTPPPLVERLLDVALDPVLDAASRDADPEGALLSLRVCDPACGSGRFLVAAARRIAGRVAALRGDASAPLAEVIQRCIHGVDRDETAVELCREALRREAGAPDLPLQEQIRIGDSLIGDPPGARVRARLAADAWCASFFWSEAPGAPPAPAGDVMRAILEDPLRAPADTIAEIRRIAAIHRFFHWSLEFAGGGFDVVIGNPPWERVKIQQKEWFARRAQAVAEAPNAAERRRRIDRLGEADPAALAAFHEAHRRAAGAGDFLRRSGRYPLCGRGDVNTYAVFAEASRSLVTPRGRVGLVVPSGIAADAGAGRFFRDLVRARAVHCLLGFENERLLFPDVHHSFKFSLLVLGAPDTAPDGASFTFFARTPGDLDDPARRITLSADDLDLLSPDTGTCPAFRSARDADLCRAIHRRVPVLVRAAPPAHDGWDLSFARLFDMATDSDCFRARADLRGRADAHLPLYEAKMVHPFDHRYGTYRGQTGPQRNMGTLPRVTDEEHRDPHFAPEPRYWVRRDDVMARLRGKWSRGWLLGWRDVCRSTDQRTLLPSLIPLAGAGDTFLLALPGPAALPFTHALYACLASFVLDYVARQRNGGVHLKYHALKQLPVLPPAAYAARCAWDPSATVAEWMRPRVLELAFTAWDLAPFARDMGYGGPPFRWDEARRAQLRCELDAAFFHLYGVSREDAGYILDSFPVVRRTEERRLGEHRSRRVILEVFDALAEASAGGRAYRSPLGVPVSGGRAGSSRRAGRRGP